jgi:NNP family nitrate/nitrite transporter-like MFS transporter
MGVPADQYQTRIFKQIIIPVMKNQLTKLNIFSLKGVQMRTFHTTWLMFFVCFFGWFGLAPLMPTIRAELHLTKAQVGNTIIASVTATIIARLLIGKLCDTWDRVKPPSAYY